MARIGSMISLAGKASKKASSTMPSSPMTPPSGCNNPARTVKSGLPPAVRCASPQSTAPAGMATVTARPRAKTVLSSSDRTSTRPICGMR